ncbi:MAG: hypothetical protein RIB60_00060 [Phycisphaerales bacterium]
MAQYRRACPNCKYNLSGQPDAPRLACPECGEECSRTQAEAHLYMKRTRWHAHIRVAFALGTALQIINLCAGGTHPGGIAASAFGGLLVLISAIGFARQNRHGFGAAWWLWGIVLGLVWIMTIHAPIIFGVAMWIIFG